MYFADRRPSRHLTIAALAALAGAALTGCGTPRVHEVYRLSSLDALPDAAQAIADERLSAGQADLRRLVINARQLQPNRIREHAMSEVRPAAAIPMVLDGSRNLHGCTPDGIAEFTARSASLLPAESSGVPMMLASVPLQRF